MKRSTTVVVLSLLLSCLAIGILILLKSSARRLTAPMSGSKANAAISGRVADVPKKQGALLTYAVDFENTVGAGEQGHTLVGTMKWTLIPVASDDTMFRFLARTRDVSLAFDREGSQGKDLGRTMARELDKPFGIELAPNGRVERMGISRDPGAMGAGLIKDLLGDLEFIQPPAGAKSWGADEADHLGRFHAEYVKAADGRVRKTKRYTSASLPEILMVSDRQKPQLSGQATYTLDAHETIFPNLVDVSEGVSAVTFTASTRAKLTLTSEKSVPAAPAGVLAGLRWIRLDENIEAKQDPAYELARKRRLVEGATLHDVLGELDRRPLSKQNLEARHAVLHKLRALFDLDPSAIRDAADLLRSGKAGANTPALLGALSDSESPESRETLAGLAKDESLSTDLREDAIANLALKERPNPATFEDLRELAASTDEEVRNAAVLGLGATARAAQDAESEAEAGRTRQELARGATLAESPEERLAFLNGLGNAGGADALSAAEINLADPRADIRVAAVAALRFAPAPRAEQLLQRVWTTDDVTSVRMAVASAASFRPLSADLVAVALSVLKADPQVVVRISVVQFLAEFLDELPAVRTGLELAETGDLSPDVRAAAAQVLGHGRPPRTQ